MTYEEIVSTLRKYAAKVKLGSSIFFSVKEAEVFTAAADAIENLLQYKIYYEAARRIIRDQYCGDIEVKIGGLDENET